MEYETLNRIVVELDYILMENEHLKAENKRLREENEKYSNEISESIKNHEATIGELLKGLVRGIKED